MPFISLMGIYVQTLILNRFFSLLQEVAANSTRIRSIGITQLTESFPFSITFSNGTGRVSDKCVSNYFCLPKSLNKFYQIFQSTLFHLHLRPSILSDYRFFSSALPFVISFSSRLNSYAVSTLF